MPLLILSKVVSIGDAKHKDVLRIKQAYSTAFSCFIDLCLRHLDSEDIANAFSLISEDNIFSLLEFSAIHYSSKQVIKVGRFLELKDEKLSLLDTMLKQKDFCSVKKLKTQIEDNHFVFVLFKLAQVLIGNDNEFPKTTGVFQRLMDEL